MTAVFMIAKGLVMIAISGAAFVALALALDYEPSAAKAASQCEARPAPACLFTIF